MHVFFAQHASDGSTRQLRLVAVVRDPTERLRSANDMMARNRIAQNRTTSQETDVWAFSLLLRTRCCCEAAGIDAGAADALQGACFDPASPLARGVYALPLAAYARAFAPRQMALVAYGGYSREPTAVLCELAAFASVQATRCAGIALQGCGAATHAHVFGGARLGGAGTDAMQDVTVIPCGGR
jgi:hypothetical protein